jgi:hypothetical protein
MQIHPSITVSVRPAPLATERPAANPREIDARPRDTVPPPLGKPTPSPLGQSVRLAVEELQARQVTGEARRDAPERAQGFDLRAHLAEIDRDVRKRLEFFGNEHGLDTDELRDLSQSFHAKLRKIYEAAKDTDAGPRRVNRAVRRAFQGVRSDLRAMVGRQVESDVTVGTTPAPGGIQPASETPPADNTGAGSGTTTTTSTVPGVTVSVGIAPPPPPPAPPSASGEERDPIDVLAEAMTAFVQRFDSMMDLFEALIAGGFGGGSGSSGGGSTSSSSLFQTLADLMAAQETGTSVDTNG